MTSTSANASVSADDRNKRMINTAACLIIGDEVLGGKVCSSEKPGAGSNPFLWIVKAHGLACG